MARCVENCSFLFLFISLRYQSHLWAACLQEGINSVISVLGLDSRGLGYKAAGDSGGQLSHSRQPISCRSSERNSLINTTGPRSAIVCLQRICCSHNQRPTSNAPSWTMNNGGESRESLDLLASAAEQSSESPQTRIKRNTACVSCRDSKVTGGM